METTKLFVDYLTTMSFASLSPEVIERSKELILDTLGITVAGADAGSTSRVIRYVEKQEAKPVSTILGTKVRTAAPFAALANGTSAHAWDMDDTALAFLHHPSSSMVSALLAIGERDGVSGRDFIEAHVLGFEAVARVSEAMPELFMRGWHPTGVLGTIGAAAACAKLMKLTPDQIASSLGIACSMTSGMRANFGTHTKGLHAGLAAKNAVIAVGLAAEGFSASHEILEHEYGFANLYTGLDKVNLPAADRAFREPNRFHMIDPGLGIKLSPCGSMALAMIPCTSRLAQEANINPDDVERVDLGRTTYAGGVAPFDDPKDSTEAQYSLNHAVAAAVVRRKAGIHEFSDEGVHDPQIAAMRKRINHFVDPELDALPEYWDVAACKVTIHLKDGRSFFSSQLRPDGYRGGPSLTKEGILGKFNDCLAYGGLSSDQAKKAVELVDSLETVENIREVAQTLTS